MNEQNLNLARKLRPKTFDEVIGQSLSVRILKNGLYTNTFFPVYLFAGQRGCGKTTTARIFATALNCEKLPDFTQNSKIVLPCLDCNSCKFMIQAKHPDFIEIDAASHTGVDNVRQIIESSSFLPIMGRKKIYLIDEAHMLSKAAFNAFLKILEEPPATVLFILATTEPLKILDTVRSRCFQLFFTSIAEINLLDHLKNICKNENINYEIDGLKIIIKESQGSARDAINLLEQVKFSTNNITKLSVLNALGHISDDNIVTILENVVYKKDPQELLTYLDNINFNSYSPEYIWHRIIEILNIAIRARYGINFKNESEKVLQKSIKDFPLNRVLFICDEFFKSELLFYKTINKHIFIELLFLRLLSENTNLLSKNVNDLPIATLQKKEEPKIIESPKVVQEVNEWSLFVDEIKKLNEPLLNSIFVQAKFINFDKENKKIVISFNQNFSFFKDIINDSINVWIPILNKVFGENTVLEFSFDQVQKVDEKSKQVANISYNLEQKKTFNLSENLNQAMTKQSNRVDVSDTQKWQKANLLLKSFPGIIEEIQDNHE